MTSKLELVWIAWVFYLQCMIISSWIPCLKHKGWIVLHCDSFFHWALGSLKQSLLEQGVRWMNHIGAAERIPRDRDWVGQDSQVWCAELRRGQTWRQECCEGLLPFQVWGMTNKTLQGCETEKSSHETILFQESCSLWFKCSYAHF